MTLPLATTARASTVITFLLARRDLLPHLITRIVDYTIGDRTTGAIVTGRLCHKNRITIVGIYRLSLLLA